MANPICTFVSLVEASPCLAGQVLSENQQLAIRIWFMVKELQAIGGTNYSTSLDTTLIADAVALARTMDLSQFRTAEMTIYKNNAVTAGATISSDTSSLLDSVKCLFNYPNLKQVELLLLCKLGVHKAYTQ